MKKIFAICAFVFAPVMAKAQDMTDVWAACCHLSGGCAANATECRHRYSSMSKTFEVHCTRASAAAAPNCTRKEVSATLDETIQRERDTAGHGGYIVHPTDAWSAQKCAEVVAAALRGLWFGPQYNMFAPDGFFYCPQADLDQQTANKAEFQRTHTDAQYLDATQGRFNPDAQDTELRYCLDALAEAQELVATARRILNPSPNEMQMRNYKDFQSKCARFKPDNSRPATYTSTIRKVFEDFRKERKQATAEMISLAAGSTITEDTVFCRGLDAVYSGTNWSVPRKADITEERLLACVKQGFITDGLALARFRAVEVVP
ncbi:MAG: hypothetical protein LBT45_02590 [Rickettsiales bacterium]|nr:hypothetical protein [Rickettsiales bacterium]